MIDEGCLNDPKLCASLYDGTYYPDNEPWNPYVKYTIGGYESDDEESYESYSDVDYSYNNQKNTKYNKKTYSDKLYKYCTDLTAKEYKYNPAIGRRKELEQLMVAILTPNKSAILVGNPGVGKTALIEGLAYNIQRNNVPDALKDYSIIQTSASILNSNCTLNGMLEKRVLEIFNLLSKESKVILFIDEMHTLIGTGRSLDKSIDIANIIKPFLTSNDICLIGATTTDEYDKYLNSDPAFQRRFLPININEPDDHTLRKILLYTMDNYSKMYNVSINGINKEYIVQALIQNTVAKRRNQYEYQYNPDLAISILSSSLGYARLNNNKEITIEDIRRAYSTCERVNGELNYSQNFSTNEQHSSKSNVISLKF